MLTTNCSGDPQVHCLRNSDRIIRCAREASHVFPRKYSNQEDGADRGGCDDQCFEGGHERGCAREIHRVLGMGHADEGECNKTMQIASVVG